MSTDTAEGRELVNAAIYLSKVKNDRVRHDDKEVFQAKVRLTKAKQNLNIPADCYTKEELSIASYFKTYAKPTGRFGEDQPSPKKKKK